MRKVLILAALFAALISPLRADNLMRGAHGPSFTTFNPADLSGLSLSNSNTTATASCSGTSAGVRVVHAVTIGKWYWEGSRGGTTALNNTGIGFSIAGQAYLQLSSAATGGVILFRTGNIWVNGSNTLASGVTYTNGSFVGVAYDRGAGLIWFTNDGTHWNSTSSGTNNPATGVGGVNVAGVANLNYAAVTIDCNGGTDGPWTGNWGASTHFSVPSGFSLIPAP